MTYKYQDNRLTNLIDYYMELNPNVTIFDLIEYIREKTKTLKEELYLTKYLLNWNKEVLTDLRFDFESEQKKLDYLNWLKGMFYKAETLENYLKSNVESKETDLLFNFFTNLYQSNVEYLTNEVESIELTIESSDYEFGSEDQQEATKEISKKYRFDPFDSLSNWIEFKELKEHKKFNLNELEYTWNETPELTDNYGKTATLKSYIYELLLDENNKPITTLKKIKKDHIKHLKTE